MTLRQFPDERAKIAHNAGVVPLLLSTFMFAATMLLRTDANGQCSAYVHDAVTVKYVRVLVIADVQPGPELSIGTARACRGLRSDS